MSPSALFSWLHLSDIHIGHGGATHVADQELVLGALRDDVKEQIGAGVPKPDVVLVTGDIAFSGACVAKDEYDRAAKWLGAIAAAAGLTLDDVYVVPGNHDVQRTVDKPPLAKSALQSVRGGNPTLDDMLSDDASRAHFEKRQESYLAFAERCAPACRRDPATSRPRLYWTHRIELANGPAVRLCGLNTALLAADEGVFGTDRGALWMGNRQLADALPGDGKDVVVVMTHHPFIEGWLHDEKSARGWVTSRAHVHLTGHVHEAANARTRSGAGGDFVHVVAGAAHGEAEPAGVPARHGYSFGTLVAVDESVELHVRPRRWAEARKVFRRDVDNADEDTGVARHRLARVTVPKRGPVAAPAPTSSNPAPPDLDGEVAEAQRRAAEVLARHPRVRQQFAAKGWSDDAATISGRLFVGHANELAKVLHHVLYGLDHDAGATREDREAMRRIFNECLRFAIDWREVIVRAREGLRNVNAIDLPTRKEALAELILAGADGGHPRFDPTKSVGLVAITQVSVPAITVAPIATTPERFVEAMVKHIAESKFSDLSAARAQPGSPAAIADVEGTLRALGPESPEGRSYYVTFDSEQAGYWQVACDAQRLKHGLPSLRLVRLDGTADSNEAATVTHLKEILKRLDK